MPVEQIILDQPEEIRLWMVKDDLLKQLSLVETFTHDTNMTEEKRNEYLTQLHAISEKVLKAYKSDTVPTV